MTRRRLLLPVVAAVLAAPGAAAAKGIPLVVDPTSVRPGDQVTVATPCTPRGWRLPPRPAGPRYTVLLARGSVSGPRVVLGRLRVDLRLHGRARFTVPELDPGAYRILVGWDGDVFASVGVRRCGRPVSTTLRVLAPARSHRSWAALTGALAAALPAAAGAMRVLR
jgi:hypothetical protein